MMPNSVGVLLIEDDPAVLLGTQQTLQLAGFEVEPFADAESAIPSIVPGVPAIVVCDVKLPGLDGMGLLVKAQSIDRDLAVILITGHGDVAMAVNAMRLGAYDFVEKPFPPDRLVEMATRAAEKRRLILQVRALRAQLADQCGIEASIIGSSSAIRRVRASSTRVTTSRHSCIVSSTLALSTEHTLRRRLRAVSKATRAMRSTSPSE